MPVPDSVTELVQRFTDSRAQYRQTHYNETQTRIDFVNPFFAALGWDMDNAAGLPEAYRQVVHEDALKIERTVKAPDYSFRLGGQRKYFLETKKPSVVIGLSRDSAYQLRRYAWTANLPVSLLSSFDELAVYDGRIAPAKDDSPQKARLDFYKYTDYLEKWDELYSRFSREAVEGGAFDRYAEEEIPLFRGRQRVDAAFLATIEGWRKLLAQALTLRNPSLSPRDLNRAVQTIIDRILFLRICEARGVEAEYKLQPAANGANVYPRLLQLFRHADDRYNSGLFHLKPEPGRDAPDTLTPHLKVDDKPLKEIIASLYYPESPFEFSVMPADILGQVYEQFLGKVIRVDGGSAVVEEKPEVRKAGGVFYTPTYIVDYIVRQTVGRLVEGKTPKQAAGITVLDPACGSGSFLIGAYQFLLDWHAAWYVADGPHKHAKGKNAVLYEGPNTTWRLTTAERKRILRGCIFGVDIDAQAVEVTKLSLLLKMLEGERAEVVDLNLSMFKERALPDMDANIKCGNSLIGSDFYDNQDMALFDTEAQLRINTFDWGAEFAPIMSKGGFSAVIGNPPYVLIQTLNQPEFFSYFAKHYVTAIYKVDTYQLFMEQGVRLTRPEGHLGYITPSSFLRNKFADTLRAYIVQNSDVEALRVFYYSVFRGASVDTAVTVLRKTNKPSNTHLVHIEQSFTQTKSTFETVPQKVWLQHPSHQFTLSGDEQSQSLQEKVAIQSTLLGGFATAYFGIQTYDRSQYVRVNTTDFAGEHWKPAIDGGNIFRYALLPSKELVDFRSDAIKSGGQPAVYEQERIGVRQIGKVPIATLLPAGVYSLNTVYNIFFTHDTQIHLAFILGIINCKLMGWYWQQMFFDQKQTFPKVKKEALLSIPIRAINFDNPADKKQHDQLVSLVEQMLSLHRALPTQTDPAVRTLTTRALAATDTKIDALVYALYGLSPTEIALVEGREPQAETEA